MIKLNVNYPVFCGSKATLKLLHAEFDTSGESMNHNLSQKHILVVINVCKEATAKHYPTVWLL